MESFIINEVPFRLTQSIVSALDWGLSGLSFFMSLCEALLSVLHGEKVICKTAFQLVD
jgi:phosphatidylinositol kinase/protein kinase (PI-3  family)